MSDEVLAGMVSGESALAGVVVTTVDLSAGVALVVDMILGGREYRFNNPDDALQVLAAFAEDDKERATVNDLLVIASVQAMLEEAIKLCKELSAASSSEERKKMI